MSILQVSDGVEQGSVSVTDSANMARELFHVGQRVKLSEEGLRLLKSNRVPRYDEALRGTVRGFGRERQLLRVQRDGIKSTDCFHMDFWEAA